MKPEAKVVKAVMREFRKRGGKIIKTTPPGVEDGTPDLVGCLHRRMFCIECKAQEEEPSPLQKKRLKEWAAAGAVTMLVWDVRQLTALLDSLGRATPH